VVPPKDFFHFAVLVAEKLHALDAEHAGGVSPLLLADARQMPRPSLSI
jgi:hypothetical protein